jgi:hypothetical protein
VHTEAEVFIFVLIQEIDGVVCDDIGDVAIFGFEFTIFKELVVGIAATAKSMCFPEAVAFLWSAVIAQMPFS